MYRLCFFIALYSAFNFGCANFRSADYKNNMNNQVISDVNEYMSTVFGDKIPTLQDYYKYEGTDSENEYRLELDYCKRRWPKGLHITDEEYIKSTPRECKDWLIVRSRNPSKAESLYYSSIRAKFKTISRSYAVESIELNGNGNKIIVDMPENRARIILRRIPSVKDPEATNILISRIESY